MPRRGVGESRDSFVSRCISVRQDEHPTEDSKESIAICRSMYRDSLKTKKKKK